VSINKAEVIFDVKGLGEVALPVPSRAPSSIAWADQLKDRTKIPLFNKGLAQLVRDALDFAAFYIFSSLISFASLCFFLSFSFFQADIIIILMWGGTLTLL
jgi:hypothetical protein